MTATPCTLYDVMFGGQCGGVDVCSPCDGLADRDLCDDGSPCTEPHDLFQWSMSRTERV